MSTWKIIWAGIKGFFTPGTSARQKIFEEATEAALDIVNSALARTDVSSTLSLLVPPVTEGLKLLNKYVNLCPEAWRPHYNAIRGTVGQLLAALSDGKISAEELSGLADRFRLEYARWFAD